jgi:hypothetical protein
MRHQQPIEQRSARAGQPVAFFDGAQVRIGGGLVIVQCGPTEPGSLKLSKQWFSPAPPGLAELAQQMRAGGQSKAQ